jgi:hypothetical protein
MGGSAGNCNEHTGCTFIEVYNTFKYGNGEKKYKGHDESFAGIDWGNLNR